MLSNKIVQLSGSGSHQNDGGQARQPVQLFYRHEMVPTQMMAGRPDSQFMRAGISTGSNGKWFSKTDSTVAWFNDDILLIHISIRRLK